MPLRNLTGSILQNWLKNEGGGFAFVSQSSKWTLVFYFVEILFFSPGKSTRSPLLWPEIPCPSSSRCSSSGEWGSRGRPGYFFKKSTTFYGKTEPFRVTAANAATEAMAPHMARVSAFSSKPVLQAKSAPPRQSAKWMLAWNKEFFYKKVKIK